MRDTGTAGERWGSRARSSCRALLVRNSASSRPQPSAVHSHTGALQVGESVAIAQVEIDTEMIEVKRAEQFRVCLGELDIVGCDADAQLGQPHAQWRSQ